MHVSFAHQKFSVPNAFAHSLCSLYSLYSLCSLSLAPPAPLVHSSTRSSDYAPPSSHSLCARSFVDGVVFTRWDASPQGKGREHVATYAVGYVTLNEPIV